MRWEAAWRLRTTKFSSVLGKKNVRSCGFDVGMPMSSWTRGLGLFMLDASMGAL